MTMTSYGPKGELLSDQVRLCREDEVSSHITRGQISQEKLCNEGVQLGKAHLIPHFLPVPKTLLTPSGKLPVKQKNKGKDTPATTDMVNTAITTAYTEAKKKTTYIYVVKEALENIDAERERGKEPTTYIYSKCAHMQKGYIRIFFSFINIYLNRIILNCIISNFTAISL